MPINLHANNFIEMIIWATKIHFTVHIIPSTVLPFACDSFNLTRNHAGFQFSRHLNPSHTSNIRPWTLCYRWWWFDQHFIIQPVQSNFSQIIRFVPTCCYCLDALIMNIYGSITSLSDLISHSAHPFSIFRWLTVVEHHNPTENYPISMPSINSKRFEMKIHSP